MRAEGRWDLKTRTYQHHSIGLFSLYPNILTKRLLNDNPRVLRRSIDDRRSNVESISRGLNLAADGDLPPLLLDVVEEGLDAVVLHGVLERAVADSCFGAVAEGVGLDVLDHGVAEFFVDGLVDVDALEVQADLAGVEEGV